MESGSASSASAAASTTASSPVLQLPAPPSHATVATQDTSPIAGALAHNDAIDLTTNDDSEVLPPPGKKQKKCSSEVWQHYTKYKVSKKGSDDTVIVEEYAKCNKCSYKRRCESNCGTSVFWNHLNNKHNIKSGQQQKRVKMVLKELLRHTVHWIDDTWKMQKRIIKFMHVEGHHSGSNMCKEFYDSIVDWNLDRRLVGLTLDNASSNDVCVKGVILKLRKISPLICDGIFFHVRCFNHILNLVAQDGLKQITGAVLKIKNTISILKHSPLQFEAFQKCALEVSLDNTKGLSMDTPTRWNSTFLMLKNAIYYRNAFDRLFLQHGRKYAKCAPTKVDWSMAIALCKCLKPFHEATELFSGTTYPTAKSFFRTDGTIKTMANAMQTKYDKYWEKSNMALAVACFLDPHYKTSSIEYYGMKIYGLEAAEKFDEFNGVIKKLFDVYATSACATSKKKGAEMHVHQLQIQSDPVHNTNEFDDIFNENDSSQDHEQHFQRFLLERSQPICSDKTELQIYMEQPLLLWTSKDTFDILSWWKLKQAEFPILCKLARDFLCIQVSTVASESAFSAGGRVVDPFRTRLDPEAVQALVCTKDWIKAVSVFIAYLAIPSCYKTQAIINELDIASVERHLANLLIVEKEENNDDMEQDDVLMDEMDE
uniref:H0716A07.13 protein n=1 Tax=Oryza sativa TaxID=4530 RepID=Q01MA5_ORYSA|nr:H0716A07.13 [Oryza sativa]CAH66110.1 OSIGBa0115D20.3 [Oryza sativa]